MSTQSFASAVFPLNIEFVWSSLRDFTFPQKLLCSIIQNVEMIEGNAFKVGSVRKISWKSGETRSSRLLELSDQFHTMKWEVINSSEVFSVISKLRCIRILETNYTLVEWISYYSSDVSPNLLNFDSNSFLLNLIEIRKNLMIGNIPILYHIHEAPSVRVIWVCSELGLPLEIREVSPSPSEKLTELPSSRGGLVTSFVDGSDSLLESGAVVQYLIEKYDTFNILNPKIGSQERVKFLKYFFFICSTMDHLLMASYKQIFVQNFADSEIVKENYQQWQIIAEELCNELRHGQYICGKRFTACDIMLGWTLHLCSLLGWLNQYEELKKYLQKLRRRPSYNRAFESTQL